MNRIKELREAKRMTQVRLSIELSVSQETVSAYENGKHYPSVQSLLKMSQIFNASCDYILGVSDTKNILQGGVLQPDELAFLSQYRTLSPLEKGMVNAYMQGISDKK